MGGGFPTLPRRSAGRAGCGTAPFHPMSTEDRTRPGEPRAGVHPGPTAAESCSYVQVLLSRFGSSPRPDWLRGHLPRPARTRMLRTADPLERGDEPSEHLVFGLVPSAGAARLRLSLIDRGLIDAGNVLTEAGRAARDWYCGLAARLADGLPIDEHRPNPRAMLRSRPGGDWTGLLDGREAISDGCAILASPDLAAAWRGDRRARDDMFDGQLPVGAPARPLAVSQGIEERVGLIWFGPAVAAVDVRYHDALARLAPARWCQAEAEGPVVALAGDGRRLGGIMPVRNLHPPPGVARIMRL